MILVTGGTGLVGSHLLLELALTNTEVRAIYRTESKLDNVKKVFSYYTPNPQTIFDKIEWIKADILDIPALEIAIEGIDYVYHAAALISFDPNDFDRLKKVNIEGTANIVNLCLSHQVRKLCYVSTIGTIGRSLTNKEATEDSEWTDQNTNVYARTKYAAEMEVWRGSQEKLEVVIVNPGVIVGPGFWETGSGKLFKTANKEYNYYPPGGTGFVTVSDVVNTMIGLMTSNIVGERFILVSKNLSFKDILTRITLPGAVFFAFIAVMPEFMSKWANLPFYFGGTGLIIIVGVALDTLQQIESHLVMRHYEGFMKKGKLRGRSR